jgi:hypothetical protein
LVPCSLKRRKYHNYLRDAANELACILTLEDITQWLSSPCESEEQMTATTSTDTSLGDSYVLARPLARSSRLFIRPFLIAAAIYCAITLTLLIASYRQAEGHFIYALDDTYIGMMIAKNLAMHGVWGVSPYEFSSSTSTPLFVLLLSVVYRVFGVSEVAPLFAFWGIWSCFDLRRLWHAWLLHRREVEHSGACGNRPIHSAVRDRNDRHGAFASGPAHTTLHAIVPR